MPATAPHKATSSRTAAAVPPPLDDAGQHTVECRKSTSPESGHIGGWILVDKVYRNALTEVFRARSREAPADRPGSYAVKVARPTTLADCPPVALLAREAWVGRRVSHPHLIPVLQANLCQEPYYVVTPWLEGETFQWLRTAQGEPPAILECRDGQTRVRLSRALWYVRQVAEALDALCDFGWVHGDVKPENIHISTAGHVTLLDLCFAHPAVNGHAKLEAGDTRHLLGTFDYIAPERVVSRPSSDCRSDIYSLGVVLYELLTGRRPFLGDDAVDLARQHRQAAVPDIRLLLPGLRDSVGELLRSMLAKDPLRRPTSPKDLIETLHRLEIESLTDRPMRISTTLA